MAVGDRRYFEAIPPDERELDAAMGLGQPDWYVRSHDAAPVYPPELRDLLLRHRRRRDAQTPTNGNGAGGDGQHGPAESG